MGWKKLVILILVFTMTNSCCVPFVQKKFYTTQYGSYRPIKSKFKITKDSVMYTSKESFIKNIYFRIDSIYITKVRSKKKELKVINTFKRLFSDGQFIEGTTNDIKNGLKDFNNLESGIAGYYKIENNKIIFEQFIVTPQDCGKYRTYELQILGDDNIKGYKKMTVKGLTGTPNW